MRAGNAHYLSERDLPDTIAVFPLATALLLPGGRMPLNIFEPRYLAMIDDAIAGTRIIGMIQPCLEGKTTATGEPALCGVGCLGRITSCSETGDGRYIVTLEGVCRFRVLEEVETRTPYRRVRIGHFAADLDQESEAEKVDREALLNAFRAWLDANGMEADWDSVSRAENASLVNALSMMAPYGPAEKQALLEAADLKTRAETLVAMTEMALARQAGESGTNLQ